MESPIEAPMASVKRWTITFFDYASLNQAANTLVKAGIVLHYSTQDVNANSMILRSRSLTVTL